MALVLANIGETELLECALKDASPEALVLKLYSNNYDGVEASIAANFTEVSGGGYAAKSLTRAGWGAAVAGDPSYILYGTAQVFGFTGAVAAVVGYFLVGATSGNLYWSERLYVGAGQAFANGDSLSVTPRFELS
jgi:hypothetical protein